MALELAPFAVSWQALFYFFLTALFSVLSFAKKSFSGRGIVFGNIVGFLVFFLGGIQSFFALVIFFTLAETATSVARKKIGVAHEKRTGRNVLGNVGAALLALFLGQVPAFFGGISAALSDTLSSELGLLSKKKPRLITTFEEVPAGTNGGMTFLGSLAAVAGALVIALVYFFVSSDPLVSLFVFIAGIVGSLADSLLGALFENRGRLDKMQVNFFATLCGTMAVFLLQALTLTL